MIDGRFQALAWAESFRLVRTAACRELWELRSYEAVIKLEQDRLVYQARGVGFGAGGAGQRARLPKRRGPTSVPPTGSLEHSVGGRLTAPRGCGAGAVGAGSAPRGQPSPHTRANSRPLRARITSPCVAWKCDATCREPP
jgi:hypothetical protein